MSIFTCVFFENFRVPGTEPVPEKLCFSLKKLVPATEPGPEILCFFRNQFELRVQYRFIIYNLCKIDILTVNLIRVIYCNMTPSSYIRDVLGLGDSCYSK